MLTSLFFGIREYLRMTCGFQQATQFTGPQLFNSWKGKSEFNARVLTPNPSEVKCSVELAVYELIHPELTVFDEVVRLRYQKTVYNTNIPYRNG